MRVILSNPVDWFPTLIPTVTFYCPPLPSLTVGLSALASLTCKPDFPIYPEVPIRPLNSPFVKTLTDGKCFEDFKYLQKFNYCNNVSGMCGKIK